MCPYYIRVVEVDLIVIGPCVTDTNSSPSSKKESEILYIVWRIIELIKSDIVFSEEIVYPSFAYVWNKKISWGMVFCKMILNRTENNICKTLRKQQIGFRCFRSHIDHIISPMITFFRNLNFKRGQTEILVIAIDLSFCNWWSSNSN